MKYPFGWNFIAKFNRRHSSLQLGRLAPLLERELGAHILFDDFVEDMAFKVIPPRPLIINGEKLTITHGEHGNYWYKIQ